MIFSLGTHCYAAHILKQLPVKRIKSPFDWLFSRPAMVAHCLGDDFATLLDPAYHRHVPIERRGDPNHGKCSHLIYDPMTLGPIFNHHDPSSEPKDREYFEQTVANIRRRQQDAVTFFLMITVWPADTDIYKTIFDTLVFFGDCRLLVINVREGHPPTDNRIDFSSGSLEVMSFYPRSHLDGISFGDDDDDRNIKSIVVDWLSRHAYADIADDRSKAVTT